MSLFQAQIEIVQGFLLTVINSRALIFLHLSQILFGPLILNYNIMIFPFSEEKDSHIERGVSLFHYNEGYSSMNNLIL